MSALGEGFEKLKAAAQRHKEQVDKGLDKGSDLAKEKTGGKYDDKIDTTRSSASDYISGDNAQDDKKR